MLPCVLGIHCIGGQREDDGLWERIERPLVGSLRTTCLSFVLWKTCGREARGYCGWSRLLADVSELAVEVCACLYPTLIEHRHS